jgi:alkylmercury lyase
MDTTGVRIAVETYHLAARGEPVPIDEIAAAAGVSVQQVEDAFSSWPLVIRDDRNRVIGFWGLHVHHIDPTHAMTVDGTTVYAWCAWDTLFITQILGTEVAVESTDPQSGTPIRLTVTPHGVAVLEPAGAVVSLLQAKDEFGADTIQTFCHYIHFFESEQTASKWIADRPGMFSISVDEAFELGRRTNQLRLGDGLDPSRPD